MTKQVKRKEIKSKTVTQSNDATSINSKRGKVKRAKRHSSKKLRQLIRETAIVPIDDEREVNVKNNPHGLRSEPRKSSNAREGLS